MTTAILRRILDSLPTADAPDSELLRRFAAQRDEPAFAELLRRHGPLVLGVCRRTLGNSHAAEDAFQAVFVQLARRASDIRCSGSLAGWLHTVARRIALSARRAEQRRQRRERATSKPESKPPEEMTWRELREVLDAELAKLPEPLRLPLILCYLEDRPQAEAAARLGWPLPMLRGRLERGRQKLRQRLERWGLPLAAPLVLLGNEAISAELRTATLGAARAALAGEALSPAVAALAAIAPPSFARWSVAITCGACLVLLSAGLIALPRPAARALPIDPAAKPEAPVAAKVDALGDPLPDGAVMRLGTRRYRYSMGGGFQSLPDGKTILLWHKQGRSGIEEARWMSTETGKVVDTWLLPQGLNKVGVSTDGRFALLANPRNSYFGFPRDANEKKEWVLALYDLRTRRPIWERRERVTKAEWRHVYSAKFSPDNRWFFSSPENIQSEKRLWDAADGKELWRLAPDYAPFEPVCFANGGNEIIFSKFEDDAVYIHDRATGNRLRSFTSASGSRWYSNDGAFVFVSGGKTGTAIRVWNTKTGKEHPPLDGHEPGDALLASVSGDGRTLATGFKKVRIWDWPSGKFRHSLNIGGGLYGGFRLSHDGKRLESYAALNSTLRIFDVETGKRRDLPGDGHGGGVGGVATTPDGNLVSIGMDQVIRTWDLKSGTTVASVMPTIKDTFGDYLGMFPLTSVGKVLALSPDGRLLAGTRYHGSDVDYIERASGITKFSIPIGRSVRQIALSPDGQYLAAAWDNPVKLSVASVETRAVRFTIPLENRGNLTAIAFSPDSRTIAVAGDRYTRFWDAQSRKEGIALETQPPSVYYPPREQSGIAYSPDERLLATAGQEGMRVWELAPRKLRAHLEAPGAFWCGLVFSPNSRFVAWASPDYAVHVWDGWTSELLGPFTGHEGEITDLAFAGDRLASASEDTTILIWDVAAAAAKKKLVPPSGDITAAWRDLAGDDGAAAFAAIRTLAAHPADTLRLVRAALKPVTPADDQRITALLKELDNPKFTERQNAVTALQKQGEPAIPALERFLAGKPSTEARRQVTQILAKLKTPAADPERLRQLRAVEVLERIGNADAKRLLEELAAGAADAALTRHSAAALKRLK